jgi:hypothetical protein
MTCCNRVCHIHYLQLMASFVTFAEMFKQGQWPKHRAELLTLQNVETGGNILAWPNMSCSGKDFGTPQPDCWHFYSGTCWTLCVDTYLSVIIPLPSFSYQRWPLFLYLPCSMDIAMRNIMGNPVGVHIYMWFQIMGHTMPPSLHGVTLHYILFEFSSCTTTCRISVCFC